MGQYFRPFNSETKEVKTTIQFPENSGLTWIPKVYRYPAEALALINQGVAESTGWPVANIQWIGDYGTIVAIVDGETQEIRGELSDSDFDNDKLTQDAWAGYPLKPGNSG